MLDKPIQKWYNEVRNKGKVKVITMTEKQRLINQLVYHPTTNVFRMAQDKLNTYSIAQLRAMVKMYYPVITKRYSKK